MQVQRIVGAVESAGAHSRVTIVVLRDGEIDIVTERRERVGPETNPLDESNRHGVDSGA